MRKISIKESRKLLPFLREEKEFNLFIIGDIENAPDEAQYMDVYVDGDLRAPKGMLLRYYRYFLVYSPSGMDYPGAARVIRDFADPLVLSGKTFSVDRMKPLLTDICQSESLTYFATLKSLVRVDIPYEVKEANVEEAQQILDLLRQVPEFRTVDEESFLSGIIDGSSRKYFVEEHGRVVSTASTSAETHDMAMIVGVATAEEFRRRGYASAILSRMCEDLLSEGKIPCLFYESPDAGRIYHRLGFSQIGTWKMLRFQQ